LVLSDINFPPGFTIDVYAPNVEDARSLALGESGTLFVGTRSAGEVYAVLDRNQDHKADKVITVVEGLNMPNGVAFNRGALYIAEVNRVLRYDDIESRLTNPPRPFRSSSPNAGALRPSNKLQMTAKIPHLITHLLGAISNLADASPPL